MTFGELALEIAARLDLAGIPYMLTGAAAVSFHGAPRSTHDLDIVVAISAADISRIKATLEPDFSVDAESIKAALREGSMFNAIHEETGSKIDFWILKSDEFSRVSFSRRIRGGMSGRTLTFPTAEDVIVIKLEWYKMSDLDKHYFDARGIATVQKDRLDRAYIARWCMAKSLTDLWERLQRDVQA